MAEKKVTRSKAGKNLPAKFGKGDSGKYRDNLDPKDPQKIPLKVAQKDPLKSGNSARQKPIDKVVIKKPVTNPNARVKATPKK